MSPRLYSILNFNEQRLSCEAQGTHLVLILFASSFMCALNKLNVDSTFANQIETTSRIFTIFKQFGFVF